MCKLIFKTIIFMVVASGLNVVFANQTDKIISGGAFHVWKGDVYGIVQMDPAAANAEPYAILSKFANGRIIESIPVDLGFGVFEFGDVQRDTSGNIYFTGAAVNGFVAKISPKGKLLAVIQYERDERIPALAIVKDGVYLARAKENTPSRISKYDLDLNHIRDGDMYPKMTSGNRIDTLLSSEDSFYATIDSSISLHGSNFLMKNKVREKKAAISRLLLDKDRLYRVFIDRVGADGKASLYGFTKDLLPILEIGPLKASTSPGRLVSDGSRMYFIENGDKTLYINEIDIDRGKSRLLNEIPYQNKNVNSTLFDALILRKQLHIIGMSGSDYLYKIVDIGK